MNSPRQSASSLSFVIDPDVLRPLISAVIAETLAALEKDRAALPDKLAYSEGEAARLLSLHSHQLRDARLRGEIEASVGPCRKILYTREQLLTYLANRRWQPKKD